MVKTLLSVYNLDKVQDKNKFYESQVKASTEGCIKLPKQRLKERFGTG